MEHHAHTHTDTVTHVCNLDKTFSVLTQIVIDREMDKNLFDFVCACRVWVINSCVDLCVCVCSCVSSRGVFHPACFKAASAL